VQYTDKYILSFSSACRAAHRKLLNSGRVFFHTVRRLNIEPILKDKSPYNPIDDEKCFMELQVEYPPLPEYGYDVLSTWRRGAERALKLISLSGINEPGKKILEVACGDGMTGYLLNTYGHDITFCDLEDWRDARAKNLDFFNVDVCCRGALPKRNFDLIYSFNAMEHVADPEAALSNMINACRPGGIIFLEFGPLYCSAWGLHAFRMIRIPYPQFLFAEKFIRQQLDMLGIEDLGRKRESLQPVNEWRVSQFHELWHKVDVVVVIEEYGMEDRFLNIIKQYPQAFRGRGLTYQDVTTQSIKVLLRVLS
jgi:SAM-dependent methyltransferase